MTKLTFFANKLGPTIVDGISVWVKLISYGYNLKDICAFVQRFPKVPKVCAFVQLFVSITKCTANLKVIIAIEYLY